MNRRKGREQAFIFLFQHSFTGECLEDIIESAEMSEDVKVSEFAVKLFNGVCDHSEIIEQIIKRNLKGWKINRVSKVSMNILKISVFEIIYEENIPAEVSINEAVELAKKYGSKEESSYINGVLGTIYKEILEEKAHN